MLFIVLKTKLTNRNWQGEDTRFLPGEESCKEAIWRTGLSAKTGNLRL